MELRSVAIEANGDFSVIPTDRFIFKKTFYYKEIEIFKVSLW